MAKIVFSAHDVSLDVFAASVWGYADRSDDLKAAFAEAIKAGNPLDELKRTFRDVWVARILAKGGEMTDAALVEGKRVNDLKGHKAGAGDTHRNAVQERAYVAAKVALGAALRACGVEADKAKSDQAKATRAARQTTGTENASKVEEATPTLASPTDFDRYVDRMAALLDATGRKNAVHLTGARTTKLMAALAALRELAKGE